MQPFFVLSFVNPDSMFYHLSDPSPDYMQEYHLSLHRCNSDPSLGKKILLAFPTPEWIYVSDLGVESCSHIFLEKQSIKSSIIKPGPQVQPSYPCRRRTFHPAGILVQTQSICLIFTLQGPLGRNPLKSEHFASLLVKDQSCDSISSFSECFILIKDAGGPIPMTCTIDVNVTLMPLSYFWKIVSST